MEGWREYAAARAVVSMWRGSIAAEPSPNAPVAGRRLVAEAG
jgi:hypothetical protein